MCSSRFDFSSSISDFISHYSAFKIQSYLDAIGGHRLLIKLNEAIFIECCCVSDTVLKHMASCAIFTTMRYLLFIFWRWGNRIKEFNYYKIIQLVSGTASFELRSFEATKSSITWCSDRDSSEFQITAVPLSGCVTLV